MACAFFICGYFQQEQQAWEEERKELESKIQFITQSHAEDLENEKVRFTRRNNGYGKAVPKVLPGRDQMGIKVTPYTSG